MDRHDDLVVALTPLIDVLERLGVAWYVGGSVASTAHGRSRPSNDERTVIYVEYDLTSLSPQVQLLLKVSPDTSCLLTCNVVSLHRRSPR